MRAGRRAVIPGPTRRALVGTATWAALLAACSPEVARAFRVGATKPEAAALEKTIRELGTLEKPARFGKAARKLPFSSTAESLLLCQLPIECPPLDYLQEEIEKLYVLRKDAFKEATTMEGLSWQASGCDATAAAKADARAIESYWSLLAASQREALAAAVESRPLFRLFLEQGAELNQGSAYLEELERLLRALEAPLRLHQREVALALQTQMMRQLLYLGNLVASGGFPYQVSKATYNEGLPRLLGRATVEMAVRRTAENVERRGGDAVLVFTVMIDGYSAPISAGNFIDLAQRGFYDGLPIDRGSRRLPASLDGSPALSSGNPLLLPGSNVSGFIDPRTGSYRTLPVEILADGGTAPVYRPEAMGARPALPWRAAGSLGMLHSLGEPDDGSSEFFVLTEDVREGSTLASQLDGVYTLFGFVLEGSEYLQLLEGGDICERVRVVSGAELMRRPGFNPTYTRRKGSTQRDYQMLGGEGLGQPEGALPSDVPVASQRVVRAGERSQEARAAAEAAEEAKAAPVYEYPPAAKPGAAADE